MTLNILHLVLFSHDSGLYDVMYHITRKYYHTFENIKTVYYCFDENITDNYSLIDDILYIKGTEGYIPNILDKTIKAFQYFNEKIHISREEIYINNIKQERFTLVRYE